VAFVVGGEPAETLAGHLDLTHPLLPDLTRASSEPPLEAVPPPSPVAPPSTPERPAPSAPSPAPAPKKTGPAARTDVA
jgi:predicted component of type VI protein secretion system